MGLLGRITAMVVVVLGLALTAGGCDDDDVASDRRAVFTRCEGDYECATVEVPVDYANPDGPTLGIAILRAPAKDPSARLGAVVVNPGGPGSAFVDRLADTYPVLSAGFAEATKRFDVVTFDWRGVGRSASVNCADDALFDRLRGTDLTLEQPGALAAVTELRTALVSSCLSRSDPALVGAMNTENAARDLDRIREALGEDELNYLGFSYGTWLGATYATLFPQRVRAFVLDSATVLNRDLEADITEQAADFEVGLQRFFEACARDAGCPLRGTGAASADPAAVGVSFDAIVAELRASGELPAGARTLSIVDLEFAVADGLRSASFSQLAADLAAASAGDASKLLARADAVVGRSPDGHYDASIVGLLAIACLDQPLGASSSLEQFAAFASATKAAHPRGALPAMLPWALCAAWPFHRAGPRLPISASASPSALVVSGRYDAITGYAQGSELVSLLANGSSLLTYEGDGHVSTLRSACVRDVVTSFLVDPAAAPDTLSCPPE